MVANKASPETQFATIKSPIDAVKFSNTIQLSPKYLIVSVILSLGKNYELIDSKDESSVPHD
jgi:hypothetical protein